MAKPISITPCPAWLLPPPRSPRSRIDLPLKAMRFKYHESVLDQLGRHGVIPGDDTPPDLVRDYVSGLYLVEIRSLRARLIAGEIPKKDYARRVAELRDRYPILSLRVELWAEKLDE